MRKPPQWGGRGISSAGKRASTSATAASSSPRSASTPRLRRGPGPDAGGAGSTGEVGVGLRGRHRLDGSAQPDLAMQLQPGEGRRGVRSGGQLLRLAPTRGWCRRRSPAGPRRGPAPLARRDGRRRPPWRPTWRWAPATPAATRRVVPGPPLRDRIVVEVVDARGRPSRSPTAGRRGPSLPHADSRPGRDRDLPMPAQVRPQHLGKGDAAVGLPVVLDDRRPHPGHGQGRPVQGVHDGGALLAQAGGSGCRPGGPGSR